MDFELFIVYHVVILTSHGQPRTVSMEAPDGKQFLDWKWLQVFRVQEFSMYYQRLQRYLLGIVPSWKTINICAKYLSISLYLKPVAESSDSYESGVKWNRCWCLYESQDRDETANTALSPSVLTLKSLTDFVPRYRVRVSDISPVTLSIVVRSRTPFWRPICKIKFPLCSVIATSKILRNKYYVTIT